MWDGHGSPFPGVVRPGEAVELESTVVAPRPPGSYRLAFDLVEELRYWFEELGSSPLDLPVEVRPRIDERRLAVRVHGAPDPDVAAALAAQDEPIVSDDAVAVAHLVPGAIPAPDWSRLLLDAHAEGYGSGRRAIEAESRSDRRRSAPGRRAAVATRASASRSSSRRSSTASSRRRTRASGRVLGATRSSRAARSSDFGRDPVVGATEDPRADAERDERGDHRVDRVRGPRQLAVEEHRTHRLDRRREEVHPVQEEVRRRVFVDAREAR